MFAANEIGADADDFIRDPGTLHADATNLFGGAATCDGKIVGDGLINAYDFAVLLWTHFKQPPYDTLPLPLGSVATVAGRENT